MDLRNICDDFLQIPAVDIPHRRQIKRFRLVKAAETGAVPAFNGGFFGTVSSDIPVHGESLLWMRPPRWF